MTIGPSGRPLDRRFDPEVLERLPCGVERCSLPGRGWAMPVMVAAAGLDWDMAAEADEVVLCGGHLDEFRRALGKAPLRPENPR